MKRILLWLALGSVLLAGCGPVIVADDARKRELVKRKHTELWSRGNLEQLDRWVAADFIGRFPGGTVEGRNALAAYISAHRERFPDWEAHVEQVIVEGNRVAARVRIEGLEIGITQGVFYEFERGRIVRQWLYSDPYPGLHDT